MASYTYEDLAPHVRACKCCRLDRGVDLPVPKDVDLVQTRALAKSFSYNIFSDWSQLNAIVKRFEPLIRKRWLKKSAKQRRETLLTARPTMPLVHRPDFEGWRNLGNRHLSREITCGKESHLTPYINLEDLLQGHSLLLFVHSRGRNKPVLFASTDAEKAHLGQGWVTQPEDGNIAMVIDPVLSKTPRKYGRLVWLSQLPHHIGTTHSYDSQYGLLTLEIQQSIYDFLLKSVQAILHDINPAEFKLAPHSLAPAPLVNPTGVWDSATKSALEADYRTPQETSLSSLSLLIEGRRLAANDHICSLREDPGYFLEQLREWREHRFLGNDTKPQPWRDVAAQVFIDALDAHHSWTWIAKLVKDMRPIDVQIRASIKRGTRLAKRDETEWVNLAESIALMIRKPMQNLEIMFPKSSGLRNALQPPHQHKNCHEECMPGSEYGWALKPGTSNAEHRAVRMFRTLAGLDPFSLDLHGLRPLVQEAQHMLDHDTEVNQLIDKWLLTDFVDLAVLADLQYRIKMFQPYCKSWVAAGVVNSFAVDRYMLTHYQQGRRLEEVVEISSLGTKSLGNPTDGRFHYPSDKRRTAETVRELQCAEAALKLYWKEMDREMKRNCLDINFLLKDVLSTDPSTYTTQDWVEEVTDLPSPKSKLPDGNYVPDRPMMPQVGNENKKTEISSAEKVKRKTQGKAQEGTGATAPAPPAAADDDDEDQPAPISIPRRSFKVMSALLPSPVNMWQAPREVSWDEFLHAMNTIGLVPEKLYGSVWIFKPLPPGEGLVDLKRSIQFHEPSNVRRGNKIDLKMVRRLGDRLKRAFGWNGDTFVCA
jgi:hypothetical protein